MHFKNRIDAGQRLAQALKSYQSKNAIIYALPRGGVVIGYEVARTLKLPLDLVITRKIGHPLNPEYAIAAISETGELVYNKEETAAINKEWFKSAQEREQKEAQRRHKIYLKGRQPTSAKDKTAIIVDDGVATGLTMEAAIKEVKKQKPAEIVIAAPVAPIDTVEKLQKQADEVVILEIPAIFLGAIGAYYDEFSAVSDQEVIDYLQKV